MFPKRFKVGSLWEFKLVSLGQGLFAEGGSEMAQLSGFLIIEG